jgi:hypothetical protein
MLDLFWASTRFSPLQHRRKPQDRRGRRLAAIEGRSASLWPAPPLAPAPFLTKGARQAVAALLTESAGFLPAPREWARWARRGWERIDSRVPFANIASSSQNPASFLRSGAGEPRLCVGTRGWGKWRGLPAPGPLSRPSPSANLVGIGKGNPLGARWAFPTIPGDPACRGKALSQAHPDLFAID